MNILPMEALARSEKKIKKLPKAVAERKLNARERRQIAELKLMRLYITYTPSWFRASEAGLAAGLHPITVGKLLQILAAEGLVKSRPLPHKNKEWKRL